MARIRLKATVSNELDRGVDELPGLVWTALPNGQADFLNRRWCQVHRAAMACGAPTDVMLS
jgi:hypothetical protein